MATLGFGPTEALAASGAPSRWLRARQKINLAKAHHALATRWRRVQSHRLQDFYKTPAEERQLASLNADTRLKRRARSF